MIMAKDLVTVIEQLFPYTDIHAKHGVQIDIRHDGLVMWVNVDGVCVARIITNGLTVPIIIDDKRYCPMDKTWIRD